VDCEQEGIVTAASDVHHKDKLSDAPERKYDEDNLMPLCKGHHDKRTARGE
jgi:5-methylcytosine-specific restriction endonuclease McrA